MRCTNYLVIILLLIAQTSFGQIYQNMAQPGYKFSRARFDSVLTIPTGLGNLKNITGGQDTGQIRFNKSDSSIYVWNGRAYIKPIGGGVSDTLKVSVSDTAAMLANYAKTAALALKVNISDTAAMLSPYVRTAALTIPTLTQILEAAPGSNEAGANQIKDLSAGTGTNDAATFGQLIDTANLRLRISDTATMLSNYAKTAAVNLKLNISDTASMLSAYARSAAVTSSLALKLNIADTATMLTNYAKTAAVNLKLNISDTATMLAPYTRVTVSSYGKNATADSTILLLSNGTRFAAKDSIGGGGASGWGLTGNAGTSASNFIGTTDNQPLKIRTNNVERTSINSDGAFIHTANNNSTAFNIAQNGTGAFFQVGNSSGNFLKIHASGNIGINQTTDAAFKLDVNGSARFQGDALFENITGNNNNFKLKVNIANKINILNFLNPDNTSQGGFLGTGSALSYGTYLTNQLNIIGGTGGVALRTNNAANIRFNATNADADNSTVQLTMFASTGNVHFQNSGTYTDIPSARVAVNSTTQGVLFPRMTTTQKNAIATPAAGLVVYDTTLNKLCVRTASAWETITSL